MAPVTLGCTPHVVVVAPDGVIYCATCGATYDPGAVSPWPPAWPAPLRPSHGQRQVAKLLRRDGPRCYYCGIRFGTVGPTGLARATIDHRVPRSAGGTDGMSNMVAACEWCNRAKAAWDEEWFVLHGAASGRLHARRCWVLERDLRAVA